MDCSPPGSSVHGDSPGKNTGVGCLFFILGIFPIQGPNLSLLRCRQILYHWAMREAPLHSKGVPYLFKHFPVMSIQFRFQMFAPKKKKKEAPIKRLWKWSCSVMSDSWWPHGLQLTRLLCPWDFPGKSTKVGCHCLLWLSHLFGGKSVIFYKGCRVKYILKKRQKSLYPHCLNLQFYLVRGNRHGDLKEISKEWG